MIDELKSEIEKTFNKKIINRGDCEALAQDIYEINGVMLSYNTLRRLFGLAEYRKPRESSLNLLAHYCGYQSYEVFCRRFTEKNTWPSWEQLFVLLSQGNTDTLIDFLINKKTQRDNFTVSLAICIRELIRKRDLPNLTRLFREPAFQFSNLSYDDALQIGGVVGLKFRDFSDEELEFQLLLEPNFRDVVFKVFVDYGLLFGKYGNWIHFLYKQKNLDNETILFVTCLKIWRQLLENESPNESSLALLPDLELNQHPILFGRIFGIKMLTTNAELERTTFIQKMQARIKNEPHLISELLYEPRVQSLVFPTSTLGNWMKTFETLNIPVKLKYHFSHSAIQQVFQVGFLLKKKQYVKANSQLLTIDYSAIRNSYQEFIEIYSSFFQLIIAKKLDPKNAKKLEIKFNEKRKTVGCPLFTDAYFEAYFDE